MIDRLVAIFTDSSSLVAVLVGVAAFATLYSLVPGFVANRLKDRMKSVAIEREELRAKQRVRLAAESDRRRHNLRDEGSALTGFVERLDLRRALIDEAALGRLRAAGFRGQNPLTRFLFFRLVLPLIFAAGAAAVLFGLGALAQAPLPIKLLICIGAAYAGFYAPVLYVRDRAQKRQKSIERAWPDALDLLLICVEAGMSVEAGLRKVSEEIGSQSVDLAEEFVLTNAELSFLQERRLAYENLGTRTGLGTVKAVGQALIQAERYGTPVATALRVLANDSRETRMNEAEKRAAALPPKLTVPMILVFLPVLFAVILGPAIMRALAYQHGGTM